MCGRFTAQYTWADIHAFSKPVGILVPRPEPVPSYNVAPTQLAWTLVPEDKNTLAALQQRWGLIPRWARDTKLAYSSINARLETVDQKPTYRAAWAKHRCIVPVSGYYEWREVTGGKRPYYVHGAGGGPVMMLGAIHERWGSGASAIDSFSIITTEARGMIASLHDRMPVLLTAETLLEWVAGDARQAMDIAMSLPDPALEYYAVSPAVGNVRNNGPMLIEPEHV